ncbi:MAG: hypothetical protein EBV31_08555 [Verrucomicrobia bacterium]|nr:hypothetical protein [Verrucomicrobiota bacterium]
MRQRWDDLFFLHWEYDPAALQARLPNGLTVDCFEGKAHLGVVGFRMNAVRPAFLPALPWLSYFNELNVRTDRARGLRPALRTRGDVVRPGSDAILPPPRPEGHGPLRLVGDRRRAGHHAGLAHVPPGRALSLLLEQRRAARARPGPSRAL